LASRCIAKELPNTSKVLSFGNTAGAVLDAPDEAQHSKSGAYASVSEVVRDAGKTGIT
jgi:hypothetical protein